MGANISFYAHANMPLQGVPKKATIQIKIRALIQTTYCSALNRNSLSLLNNIRMRKNTQFYTHGT